MTETKKGRQILKCKNQISWGPEFLKLLFKELGYFINALALLIFNTTGFMYISFVIKCHEY